MGITLTASTGVRRMPLPMKKLLTALPCCTLVLACGGYVDTSDTCRWLAVVRSVEANESQTLLISDIGELPPTKEPTGHNLGRASIVTVQPHDPVHKMASLAPPGTIFQFSTGIHYIQQIEPKDGQSFIGTDGTILSGAEKLQGFVRKGNHWVISGQRKRGKALGICEKNKDRSESRSCQYSQDLFMDDLLLVPVENLSDLKSGFWHFDFEREEIYVADDPESHLFEVSVTPAAFVGATQNVTIRRLTIEKFANPAQMGSIHNYSTTARTGRGWIVENNTIRLNHGIGLRVDEGAKVGHNQIHHNGQLGINAQGTGVLIEHNEIAYNNTRRFDYWWEAGGAKFVRTKDLTVRHNHVHHNIGPGLWTDADNLNVRYHENLVEDNYGPGIFHEISYDALIVDNLLKRNGLGIGWYMGAGILVAASSNVEVTRNQVLSNANGIVGVHQERGKGPNGLYEIEGLYVHHNHVEMNIGASGVAVDPKYTRVRKINRNRFDSNTYVIGRQKQPFVWLGRPLSKVEWSEAGQDLNGQFFVAP